jgi:hypothetical protein
MNQLLFFIDRYFQHELSDGSEIKSISVNKLLKLACHFVGNIVHFQPHVFLNNQKYDDTLRQHLIKL